MFILFIRSLSFSLCLSFFLSFSLVRLLLLNEMMEKWKCLTRDQNIE